MKTLNETADRLILQHSPGARALVPLLSLAIVACVVAISRSDADHASALVLVLFGLILALGTVWQTQTSRLILDIPSGRIKLRRRSLIHLQRKDWPLETFGGVMAKKADGDRFALVLLVGSPASYTEQPMTKSLLDIKTAQSTAEKITQWLKLHRVQGAGNVSGFSGKLQGA